MLKTFFVFVFCALINWPQLSAEEPAFLAAAKAAFEAARDDVHREKVHLVWDQGAQPMPHDVEVLVLRGYINHDLFLLQWHDDQATISVVTVDRQWFYHPKANARSFATITMSNPEAAELWQSIHAIIRLQATEDVDPDKEVESRSGGSRSHESYHLLTWRLGMNTPWVALPVLRGSSYHADIRDLDEVKMVAISTLVWSRIPQKTWIADPEAKTADRWRAWWRTMLPGLKGDGLTQVDQRTRLLVNDACEMLGDLGDPSDAALLTDIAHGLRPPQARDTESMPATTYSEDCLRQVIAQSTQRIALRQQWNAVEAIQTIHANNGITYTGNDQERWLRQQFYQRDPEGYVTLLRADLDQSECAVTSITELAKLYPGRYREDLQRLLQRKEPDVVFQAAAALLGIEFFRYGTAVRKDFAEICTRSENDPQLRAALAALEHLASDPTVPISAWTHSFDSNPRTSACEILSQCPSPWGWDKERYRRQLARVDEVDGRFISHLLRRLELPQVSQYQSVPRQPTAIELALLIPIWRRALVTPITRGTILAIEELMALRDAESVPRLLELLGLLRDGATPRPVSSNRDDGKKAALPWISIYEVDPLDKTLKALRDSLASP